ncbi:methyltransferase domain-containing protein [Roseovarius litoreus]|uniref:methyltransferase domain-containing protein n=1 Tax=Roseovarius litoreus TaxID=1155722 RepID=UPI00165FD39B|nr:methyltransferase domain-containing protein [Roseovarius litoreus]
MGERIRVVFLVMTPQIWPSVEPVWRKVATDERFHSKVVVIEKNSDVDALSGLQGAHELLTARGVPFAKGASFSLAAYEPHIVFYPLPYDHFYPPEFAPELAQSIGARIAYVHYGLEVGGGAYNAKYQHDEPILRNAWRIFARSRHQMSNFAKYCENGNAHVVLTGHPRGDKSPADEGQLPTDAISRANGRKIVLWTPHFSVAGRRKWSSFLENHATIAEEIEKRKNLFFIFRPHPFLESTLRTAEGWDTETVNQLFDRFRKMENLYFDTSPDYWPTFNGSDALMTDPGSFLVEFLLLDRPICLLESKDGIGLSQEVAGFTAFEAGATGQEIAAFLDLVEQGKDEKSAARQNARQQYFGSSDGLVAQRIVDEMVHGISDRPYTIARVKENEKHEAAFRYWKQAKTTFLAPEEYYAKQEVLLKQLLERLQPAGFALDAGCGNGRFTEVFARFFEFVEGFDPGEELIKQARANAQDNGISNIEYRIDSLETPSLMSTYDLVSCMGVLSGVIDNERFLQITHWLRAACKPDGLLLLKDSLSVGSAQSIEADGYVAVYRNISDYLAAFRAAGFSLEEEIVIAPTNDKGLTNRLFVLQAVASRVGA